MPEWKTPDTGDKFMTANHGLAVVITYHNSKNVVVRFVDGTVIATRTDQLKSGKVKNPNGHVYYGVGIGANGEYTAKTHRDTYNCWLGMLARCYDAKTKERLPTYAGCTVAKRWHNFQNFAADYEAMVGYGNKGWQLDKDILFPGNKMYSRNKCCLVPSQINTLIIKPSQHRGLPTGVTKVQNKCGINYAAYCRVKGKNINLGMYNTANAAQNAYQATKDAEVIRVVNKYKKFIDQRVYAALTKGLL